MLSNNDVCDRFIFFALGCLLGWLLGRTHSRPKDQGGSIRTDLFMLVMIVVVSASAVLSAINQRTLHQAQKDAVLDQQCSDKVLASIAGALTERTTYSNEINEAERLRVEADAEKDEALTSLIALALSGTTPSTETGREVVENFSEKLRKSIDAKAQYLLLLDAQKTKANNYPYPTVDDYRSCLSRGGTK